MSDDEEKFSESLAYVSKTLWGILSESIVSQQGPAGARVAEIMGQAIGTTFVDALRATLTEGRFGLKVAREAEPEPAPAVVGNLPEHLRKPKILVLGLPPDQQEQLRRRFPRAEFRFLASDAKPGTVDEVSRSCDLAVRSKFTDSSVRAVCKIIDAPDAPAIAQKIEEHFPQLRAVTAAERRASRFPGVDMDAIYKQR